MPLPTPDARRALLLDFDGTLVDIAPTPGSVVVEPGLPDTLRSLRASLGGALAIVTGRTIADVDGFLPGLDLDTCGMHGLERRVAGRVWRPEGLRPLVEEVAALRARFADRPGVLVEDKRIGVALHWRLAPDAADEAADAMADLAARLGPGYRVQDGKAVRELVPAASGKGGAVRALMTGEPYADRLPIFVGDDLTDEHGFEAVNELGGLSLKLGPGPTRAARRLPSPAAFRSWLAGWAAGRAALDALPTA